MIKLKEYEKYNLTVLCLFIVLFGIFYGTNFFFYKDYGLSLWLNSIYNKKINYSNTIKKPKIVIIGGSNVLFSVKAEDIEKGLKIPVVNAGSNAGLGLIYILDRAKRDFIKPGDTVLMSIEYNLFNSGNDASDVLFKYALSFDRDYFSRLNMKEKLEGYFAVSFKDLIKSLKQRMDVQKKGIKAVTDVIYNPENLTKNGDQLMNVGQKTGEFIERNAVYEDLKFHINPQKPSMKEFIRFVNWCKANNVKIIYTFPTIPYHKEYSTPEYNTFRADLKEFFDKENILVLDTSEIIYMQNDKFYDTGYHLNYEGRIIRTSAIIREFKKLCINKELKCK